MLSHIFHSATFALLLAFGQAAPRPNGASLPDCAAAPAECQCPSGTTLQKSSTYALIGAAAKDVKAITGSCKRPLVQGCECFIDINLLISFRYRLVWRFP